MKTRLLRWRSGAFPALIAFLATMSLVLMGGCDGGIGPVPPDDYASDEAPAWSPDGSRIAYFHVETSTDRPGGYPTGLYVLDLDTDERSLVVEGNASNPDWSPGGERLAFDAGDIFTVRPDGSDLRQVTDFGSAFFPAWSPDGQRIAFDVTTNQPRVPADSSGIWLASPDGSNRRHVGLGRNPGWSPTGDRLVYEGPPGPTDSENQIWVADTTGENRVRLTENASIINRYPAWSLDGEWIAWTADSGLWLMRSDGSEQRIFVEYERFPVYTAWAPDSERLVFSGPVPDRSKSVLWTVRRDGSDLQQLTS